MVSTFTNCPGLVFSYTVYKKKLEFLPPKPRKGVFPGKDNKKSRSLALSGLAFQRCSRNPGNKKPNALKHYTQGSAKNLP